MADNEATGIRSDSGITKLNSLVPPLSPNKNSHFAKVKEYLMFTEAQTFIICVTASE